MMTPCLIALGCNQGDCGQAFQQSLHRLKSWPNTRLLATSEFRETRPVGAVQGTFLNGAVLIETACAAARLMDRLLQLEADAGRNRQSDPGNRPLDLDILLYGNQILDLANLTVPHPRLSFRRFVLRSATEIAGDMVHPQLQQTLAELWHRIQYERNLVAVWLPENFDVQQLDLRPVGPVHWLVPSSSATLLAGIRRHLTVSSQWLVVCFKTPQTLDQLRGAIKLLILVDRSEVPGSVPGGPRWHLSHRPAAQLQGDILTAIESMKPD